MAMGRDGRKNEEDDPSMELLAGEDNEGLGKRSNRHGFVKKNTLRRRGGRDEPRDGNAISQRWKTWLEKLAERSPEL